MCPAVRPPPSLPSFTCISEGKVSSSSALLSRGRTHTCLACGYFPRTETSLLSIAPPGTLLLKKKPRVPLFWESSLTHVRPGNFNCAGLGGSGELSILLGLAPNSLSDLGQVFISLGFSFPSMENRNITIPCPRAAETARLFWNHLLICAQGYCSVL